METNSSPSSITVDLAISPRGPRVTYSAADSIEDVDAELPAGWAADYSAQVTLSTGEYAAPLVMTRLAPDDLRSLRAWAEGHSDRALAHHCSVALGERDPVRTRWEWEWEFGLRNSTLSAPSFISSSQSESEEIALASVPEWLADARRPDLGRPDLGPDVAVCLWPSLRQGGAWSLARAGVRLPTEALPPSSRAEREAQRGAEAESEE